MSEKIGFFEHLRLMWYGVVLSARLAPSYWPSMLLGEMISAGQPMAVLFFSARIISELSGGRDLGLIATYAVITVALTFLLSAFGAWLGRVRDTSGDWRVSYERIQLMQAERYATMDYSYTEDSKIFEMLARMDITSTGNGLGIMKIFFGSRALAYNVFSIIFSALLMVGLPDMGGGIYIWLIVVLLFSGVILYQRRGGKMMEEIYNSNAAANTGAGFYMNYVSPTEAAKDIRLYNQKSALMQLFKEAFNAESWMRFFFFEARSSAYNTASLAALGGLFYLLVGRAALVGGAPTGAVVQSVGAATALAYAFGALLYSSSDLYNNAPYIKPMREFLGLTDRISKGDRPVAVRQNGDYEFEFRNVSFRYPSADGYALSNLNLKLNTGKRLAVVGLNGSGKTTMIKLLCRLYQPTEGEILLDGVNISEYDYAQYISLFSVVFQDYALFPLQLGANVAASDDYDESVVRECIDGAGFTARLSTMPDGLSTMLYRAFDEDGVQISGGEAQKLALARALYKNAPIVVLDEPTAALDPMAEFEVYSTFDRTIGDRTAVFISHRLSSCRFCSDIAVFDGGRMIQRGSHEQLVGVSGKYAELWAAQSQYYTEE